MIKLFFITIMILGFSLYGNIFGKVEGKYCKQGAVTDTSRVFICNGLPQGMLTTDISLYLHEFAIPNNWSDPGSNYEIEVLARAEIYYNPNASKPFATIYTNWGIRKYKKQSIWGGLWWAYPMNFNLSLRNVPLHGKIKISISMIEYDSSFPHNKNDTILLDAKSNDSSLNMVIYPIKGVHRYKQFIKFGEKRTVIGDKSGCSDDDCIGGRIDFTVTRYDKAVSCQNYASTSVEQYNKAKQFACGFKPPNWSDNKKRHFNWCMRGENTRFITTNLYKRDTLLNKCKKTYMQKKKICKKYKVTSVAQYYKAKKFHCPFNFKTGTWSANENEHFKWCMHGNNFKKVTDSIARRNKKIIKCKEAKKLASEKAKIKKICIDYALEAVTLNHEAQKYHCNFKPPVWSNEHQKHFKWCTHGNNYTFATDENKKRNNALKKCKIQNTNKQTTSSATQYCKIYAQDAINQYNVYQQRNCGLGGLGWSLDYNAHLNWCIKRYKKGDLTVIANETAKRNATLANCK